MSKPLHIVILAAGEGTRMKSTRPKVLHTLGGRPLLCHVLAVARTLQPEAIHVVVGNGADQVMAACGEHPVNWVLQSERRGTGHAVMQAMPQVPDGAAVLILPGDHPLTPQAALDRLAAERTASLAVLTTEVADPGGYGRVLRGREGEIAAIVEDRDATSEQLEIREINTGIMLADAASLRRWLGMLECNNAKREFYLTDIFAFAHGEQVQVLGVLAAEAEDLQGVNDRRQLAALEKRYRRRQTDALMDAGVQIIDADRIDIRGSLEVGADVQIDVNVILEGDNRLADGVSIGPGCVVKNCDLAAGTRVHAHSVLEGVTTTGACDIGPFARLRPGTEMAAGSRIGNFVEAKMVKLGAGSKASHLTYLGDSEIGSNVNIGAGTITCNYDGAHKHQTTIEDDVFVGSNSALVAPVTIHRGATIGAGSTISKDAPADTLTVSRARQTSIRGWKRPRKAKDRK